MAITDAEAARQMAEQHPELHQSRQIAFGQNYLQDLEQGTGTSQYYSGFGLAPDWVTGAIGAPADTVTQEPTPVIQDPMAGDAQVAEQIAARDRDIADASTVSPMDQAGAVAAMTQPEAYNIPGTMPQTPVSGVWGPQDYLQDQTTTPITDQAGAVAAMTPDAVYSLPGESDPFLASGAAGGARLPTTPMGPRVELPSGDVFAADDPMLQEKMDYTEKTPAWWETARDKFLNTGQDVGNFFTNLAGQGIDVAKMAGSAIMNFIQPGLGLVAGALEETPIDKFNREYQLGGDLYQNVVSQVSPDKEVQKEFEGRLEGYADDLIAGTGEGKDPFGINTVSMYGDYPKYATDTYNKIVAKEEAGGELGQFEKDQKEYYGHISGLTGKTNIPGTPLMTDTSPLKTFPEGDIIPDEDIIIPPKKPEVETYAEKAEEAWKDIIEVQTIAGNDVYFNKITGEGFPSAAELISAAEADAAKTDILPTDIIEGGDFEEIGGWEDAARLDAERKIREERAAKLQKELETFKDPIQTEAERRAIIQAAHNNAMRAQAIARHEGPDTPGDGGGGHYSGGHHWARGGRVGYGKGGIVDLL